MKWVWRVLPPVFVFALVTLLMQWIIKCRQVPKYMLPLPSDVLQLFRESESRKDLLSLLWVTAEAALLGFAASAVLGVTAAVVLSSSKWLRRAFYPYTVFFQTVPIIAVAPLLIYWFDAGLKSVAMCAFLVSVFPVIANTLEGLISTDPALLDLFRLYRAGPIARLVKLRLPFALPNIFTGLRVAAGLAVIGAIVSEFMVGEIVDHEGLGVRIVSANKNGKMNMVFASVLMASLLGMALFAVVNGVGRLVLRRWYASSRD